MPEIVCSSWGPVPVIVSSKSASAVQSKDSERWTLTRACQACPAFAGRPKRESVCSATLLRRGKDGRTVGRPFWSLPLLHCVTHAALCCREAYLICQTLVVAEVAPATHSYSLSCEQRCGPLLSGTSCCRTSGVYRTTGCSAGGWQAIMGRRA